MSLFVEVDSVEKDCKVIINLDGIGEIAPLTTGGCALFFLQGGVFKVKNNYDEFKQFAMQTVSSDDIAKRVKALKGGSKNLEIPTL
jgi:hypothetical protein